MLSIQPDLVVTNLSLGQNSAVVGNDFSLAVNWTVKNQGNWAPTQNWVDNFYLSSNSSYDSTAVFVGGVTRDTSFPLAIGGSYTSSTELAIPNTALRGSQYLLVYVDQANSINESDLSNNVMAAFINLTAPSVNLAVSGALVVPTSLVAGNGGSAIVSWTVTNSGADTAVAAWTDGVYLSSATTLNAGSVKLGEFSPDPGAETPFDLAPAQVTANQRRYQSLTLPCWAAKMSSSSPTTTARRPKAARRITWPRRRSRWRCPPACQICKLPRDR